MSSQAYYRKWRPQTFAELVGQEHVARTLLNAVRTGRVAHAYVFGGPRGVGKTSAARLLAKAVNCEASADGEPCGRCEPCRAIADGRALDVVEIDAASNRGIDEIRELRERVHLAPSQFRQKLYILDEAHMLTGAAANAFLKTLEEPPPQTIFVLATTEASSLMPTILSRCQRLDFRRIPLPAALGRLQEICAAEGVEAEPAALALIAQGATGSLRDAEVLLDQVVAYAGQRIGVEHVRAVAGLAGAEAARQLVECLVAGDLAGGLRLIQQLVEAGADPGQFSREVVDYLRGLLLLRAGEGLADLLEVTPETLAPMRDLARRLTAPQVLQCLRSFAPTDGPPRRVGLGQLALEMAFVDAALTLSVPAAATAPAQAGPAETPGRTPRPFRPERAAPPRPPAPAERATADAAGRPAEGASAPATSAGQASAPVADGLAPLEPPLQRTSARPPVGRPPADAEGRPAERASVSATSAGQTTAPVADGLAPLEPPLQRTSARSPVGQPGSPRPARPEHPEQPEGERRDERERPREAGRPAVGPERPRARPDPAAEPPPLAEVKARWPDVIERCGAASKQVQAFLRDVRPVGVEGGAVLLHGPKFHLERLQEDARRAIVEDVLSEVLGRRCRVRAAADAGEAPREPEPPADPLRAVLKDPLLDLATQSSWRVKRIEDQNGEVVYDAQSKDDPAVPGPAGQNPGGAG